jgi:hypothetical protein
VLLHEFDPFSIEKRPVLNRAYPSSDCTFAALGTVRVRSNVEAVVPCRLNNDANLLFGKLRILATHGDAEYSTSCGNLDQINWHGFFLHDTVHHAHTIGRSALASGNDPVDFAATKMHSNSIVNGYSRTDTPTEQQAMIGRTSLGFPIIVGAAATRKETQAI